MAAGTRGAGTGPGKGARHTFVVGRVTPSTTVVRMLEERPAPLPGPWTLEALVRSREPRLRLVR